MYRNIWNNIYNFIVTKYARALEKFEREAAKFPEKNIRHLSEETKQKMRKAKLGVPKSEEHKANIALAMEGKIKSREHKAKLSVSHTGMKLPPRSKETLDRMSVAKSGKNNPIYGKTGEKSPNWRGGLSSYPYPINFTKQLKEYIRERDNHICQLCGKTEEQNRRKLDVHHIDYNKENLNESNLISLCKSCHQKTSWNREFWIDYFNPELMIASAVLVADF